MEPPAYSPPEGNSAHRRSIQDLRAQILANGSILRPKDNGSRHSLDHIEIIVAKAPSASAQTASRRTTHWTREQAFAMTRGLTGAQLAAHVAPRPESLASTPGGQHYAVLIKRSSIGVVKIVLKGEPRDSVEDALEWMLELTEKLVHDLVVREGKPSDGGCCVM